jgi:hypothetical protein
MGEGNSVPTYNEYALELLLEKGFKVTILSYCGEEREAHMSLFLSICLFFFKIGVKLCA